MPGVGAGLGSEREVRQRKGPHQMHGWSGGEEDESTQEYVGLKQGLENFFYKGSDGKYFRLCWPCGLCPNYSILPLKTKGSHRQFVKEHDVLLEWSRRVGWIWPAGCTLPTPDLRYLGASELMTTRCSKNQSETQKSLGVKQRAQVLNVQKSVVRSQNTHWQSKSS